MAQVRYAICGHPCDPNHCHLFYSGWSCRTLRNSAGIFNLTLRKRKLELVDTSAIEDALGWGYAGFTPEPSIWEYTGAPFGKYRTEALVQKALEAALHIEDADLVSRQVLNPNLRIKRFNHIPSYSKRD